jgi:hypothetical protein
MLDLRVQIRGIKAAFSFGYASFFFRSLSVQGNNVPISHIIQQRENAVYLAQTRDPQARMAQRFEHNPLPVQIL